MRQGARAAAMVTSAAAGYQALISETTMQKLTLASLLLAAVPALAVDLGANAGLSSEYIFRGIPQSDGKAAAFGGLDLGAAGFYAGTWASTVDSGSGRNDGLEIDYYGGYGGEAGDFRYGIGGTWYSYTDQFDDDYKELNLSGGWRFLTLNVAIGEYDNFGGPTLNYQFYDITAEYRGWHATIGIFADDFDGNYYEAGYGDTLTVNDVELFDYSFVVIYSDDKLLGGDDDINIVAQITKNFSLFSN